MWITRRHFMATAGALSLQALITACGSQAPITPTVSTTPTSAAPPGAASAAPSAAPSLAASVTTGGVAAPTPPITATHAATPAAAAVATPRLDTSAKLTLYNAQHEKLVKGMVEGFTAETGVRVDIRSGKDFDLANQIAQEGAGSPADAFITENSPAMQVVAARGLFAPIDRATLAQIPARFSPTVGDWMGVAGRSAPPSSSTTRSCSLPPPCRSRSWTFPARVGGASSASHHPARTSRRSSAL